MLTLSSDYDDGTDEDNGDIQRAFEREPHEIIRFRREAARELLTYTEPQFHPGVVKRRKTNYSTPSTVRLGNVKLHWPVFTEAKNRWI